MKTVAAIMSRVIPRPGATIHVRDERAGWATGAAACHRIAQGIHFLWSVTLIGCRNMSGGAATMDATRGGGIVCEPDAARITGTTLRLTETMP